MDKSMLPLDTTETTELNSWVRENQKNISQAVFLWLKIIIYQWDVYPKYGVPVPTLIVV